MPRCYPSTPHSLTDQEQLSFLLNANAATTLAAIAAARASSASFAAAAAGTGAERALPVVEVATYEWGGCADHLRPLPFDLVIVRSLRAQRTHAHTPSYTCLTTHKLPPSRTCEQVPLFPTPRASDCVLPKLYPIEPLVAALVALTARKEGAQGSSPVVLMSYEHRMHAPFDPKV